MTVEEIFSKISQRMIGGLMFHEQMSNYYDFLNLRGYKKCHEYHYLEETCEYKKLCKYYINHHNKLISKSSVDEPKVIPDSWYRYTRQDVDMSTKKTAIKNGINMWVEWEKETKKLYESMYIELMNIGEIAAMLYVKGLICDVDCELKKVERYALDRKSMDYDLAILIPEQHEIHEKYKEKIKEIGEYLC